MKTTNKKPRAGSKLKNLSEERQAEIAEFALANSQLKTAQWLGSQGISIGQTTVSLFLSWYRTKEQLGRNAEAVQTMLKDMGRKGPRLTPKRMQELGQSFFSGLALAQQDPRIWQITQQIALAKE